jgi:hypothetical protein
VLENALNAALKSARKFYEKCRQFYFDAFLLTPTAIRGA